MRASAERLASTASIPRASRSSWRSPGQFRRRPIHADAGWRTSPCASCVQQCGAQPGQPERDIGISRQKSLWAIAQATTGSLFPQPLPPSRATRVSDAACLAHARAEIAGSGSDHARAADGQRIAGQVLALVIEAHDVHHRSRIINPIDFGREGPDLTVGVVLARPAVSTPHRRCLRCAGSAGPRRMTWAHHAPDRLTD